VHVGVRVVGGRILYERDLVPKFSGKANGCLYTRVSDQANNDDSVNAVSLQQQVEIRVGEPTRAPVFRRDNIDGLRLELLSDLPAPRSVLKGFDVNAAF